MKKTTEIHNIITDLIIDSLFENSLLELQSSTDHKKYIDKQNMLRDKLYSQLTPNQYKPEIQLYEHFQNTKDYELQYVYNKGFYDSIHLLKSLNIL